MTGDPSKIDVELKDELGILYISALSTPNTAIKMDHTHAALNLLLIAMDQAENTEEEKEEIKKEIQVTMVIAYQTLRDGGDKGWEEANWLTNQALGKFAKYRYMGYVNLDKNQFRLGMISKEPKPEGSKV
jgi:hypothetical protein